MNFFKNKKKIYNRNYSKKYKMKLINKNYFD